MEAEWGSLNNGLPQISVRVLGITFFVVPDHFPGYEKAESDFICLRTFMPMETVNVRHKAFLDAAFNKIASNIRMVKIYSVENDGILYAFFEVVHPRISPKGYPRMRMSVCVPSERWRHSSTVILRLRRVERSCR